MGGWDVAIVVLCAFAIGAGITSLLLINNVECDITELKDAMMRLLLTKILSLSTQIKESQPGTEERRCLVAQRDLLQDLRNELFFLFADCQEKREENPKVEDKGQPVATPPVSTPPVAQDAPTDKQWVVTDRQREYLATLYTNYNYLFHGGDQRTLDMLVNQISSMSKQEVSKEINRIKMIIDCKRK